MGIRTFSRFSYAYAHQISFNDTNFTAFEVAQDLTNSPESDRVPDSCEIKSVEFEFTADGSATQVTMYIARDSQGSAGITPGGTTGATAALTEGLSSNKSSVVFEIDSDYHFDSSVSNTKKGSIYIIAKVNNATGTPTGNIRLNWRA